MCVVSDPGIDETELDQLADDLDRLGIPVVAGFSTHLHWDHLLWHARFGDVPRYATARLRASVAPAVRERAQAMAAESASGIPLELIGLVTPLPADGGPVPGEIVEHEAHALGHAAVLLADRGVLLAGDMLSAARGLDGHKAPGGRMSGVTGRRPTVQRIDDPDEEAPDVRLAEQRDVPRIAATLTVALADSRWTRWALPDDGRMQRLTRLHELDAGHRGVATRQRLGHRRRRRRRRVGAARREPLPCRPTCARPWTASCPTWRRTAATAVRDDRRRSIDGARPAEPHWWLAHLGVRPTPGAGGWRRRCSRRCWCAATPRARPPRPPSHSWANVRFLRGFGFEVTAELRTTDDELPLWVLVRQPLPR